MSAFAWALLAAFCWGLAPLFEKAGLRGAVDPVIGVFIRSLGVVAGAFCFLPLVPRLPERLGELSGRTWLCFIAGGLLASILGQICFYRALKTGDLSRVVPIGATYPVVACLLGVVFFKEPITLAKTLGILLVVVGTYLLR